MKFTKIPADTFNQIQLNAGILAESFDPATQTIDGIVAATSGGVNFTAVPSYTDYGDDIDNCPKNTKELKKLDSIDVKISGTAVTMTAEHAKKLIAAADVDELDATHIVPRKDLAEDDFEDLWWVGDYSSENNGDDAGFIAIHMMNTLSTGGFAIQSGDKAKGTFAFEYTAHASIAAQDVVPYELYIKEGGANPTPYVVLKKHVVTLTEGDSFTLRAAVLPADSVVTWTSADDNTAEVTSGGVITGIAAGSTIITATITVDGVDYDDTCTVIVEAAPEPSEP